MKSLIMLAGVAAVLVIAGQARADGKSASSPTASKPGSVPGVVVQAPPKRSTISPKKKAALDAEAAKRKTWQTYRATAAPTPARSAGAGAEERAENYPGLHARAR